MGGYSNEREISLRTGKAVLKALRSRNYNVDTIDITRSVSAYRKLLNKKIDIAFIALHGKGGEDGTIQGTLETMGIPYTGSGVLASALAMHKGMTKKILRYHRIPTADFQTIEAEDIKRNNFHQMVTIPLPLVVKPATEGSTIGTTIVRKKTKLRSACRQAVLFDQQVLLERFIEGRGMTTGIVGDTPLPVIEIVPRSGFYNFSSKYTPGSTKYIVPVQLPKRTISKIQRLSLQAYHALGCEGVARVDLILSHPNNRPYILEINTIPGMTETSLLPMAARYAGMSFADLVEKIILSARLKGNRIKASTNNRNHKVPF